MRLVHKVNLLNGLQCSGFTPLFYTFTSNFGINGRAVTLKKKYLTGL